MNRPSTFRFARSGVDVIAIDCFGRTSSISKRHADFDLRPNVQGTTPEGIAADTAAAVAALRAEDPNCAVLTIGFCLGGSNS